MKKYLTSFLLVACSTALAQPAYYITDKVYAPVRAEQNEKGKLLHNGLENGTPVTVLEKNDQTGYARIRTTDNIEGWIRTQYLSTETPAGLQLEQANALVAQLRTEKAQLEEQLVSIKQISGSQIDTHERNAELGKQNSLLIAEKELLTTDNERLKDRKNQIWFLYGGLLVAIGSIVAVLIQRIPGRRRNNGWR